MNISDEAVEAAIDALVMTRMGDYNITMQDFRVAAREVLEAAAPHLMAAEDARRKSAALATYPLGVTTTVSQDEGGAITVTHPAGAGE